MPVSCGSKCILLDFRNLTAAIYLQCPSCTRGPDIIKFISVGRIVLGELAGW